MSAVAQEKWIGSLEYTTSNEYEFISEDHLRAASELFDRTAIEEKAQYLIANKGKVSAEYKTAKTYHDDARTLLFEALTASGHLSKVEISGSLEEIHKTMLSVLLDAYSDDLPAHEKRRRFAEICEELTIQEAELQIATGLLPLDTEIATISDFPEAMGEKSAQNLGYRTQNKKGMVRSSRLLRKQDGSYTRISEQVSRSNANSQNSFNFLSDRNVLADNHISPDIAVLSSQLIHSYQDGVVDLIKRLDEHQGAEVRYGEAVRQDQVDYQDLREVSAERERAAECYTTQLAEFLARLDFQLQSGELNRQQYNTQLKAEVHKILQAICVMDPSYAKDCFGEAVQDSYKKASDLVAAGDIGGAEDVISANQHREQTVSFCGMSISAEQAKQMGAEVDSLGNLLKLGLEKWSWKRGVCRVDNCPTKPKNTDVGPCNVCRGCQHEFDRGRNPANTYRSIKKAGKLAVQKPKTIWEWFKSEKKSKKHAKIKK